VKYIIECTSCDGFLHRYVWRYCPRCGTAVSDSLPGDQAVIISYNSETPAPWYSVKPSSGESLSFGEAVRSHRKRAGISQGKYSRMFGISRNYLSMIERGEANNLSYYLRKSIEDAIGFE